MYSVLENLPPKLDPPLIIFKNRGKFEMNLILENVYNEHLKYLFLYKNMWASRRSKVPLVIVGGKTTNFI